MFLSFNFPSFVNHLHRPLVQRTAEVPPPIRDLLLPFLLFMSENEFPHDEWANEVDTGLPVLLPLTKPG